MTKRKLERVVKEVLDKVDAERSQNEEPVPAPTSEPTATGYPASPVYYCLFINDKAEVLPGRKYRIEGTWYAEFIDTRTPDTCHGPFKLLNKLGQPFVGFVDMDILKDLVRHMSMHLQDYQKEPLTITNRGFVFMSTLVYIAKK